MFRANMGPTDRIVRLVVGVALAATGLFTLNGLQGDLAGIVVAALALPLLATSLTGFCPLYLPWGISTLGRKGPPAAKA